MRFSTKTVCVFQCKKKKKNSAASAVLSHLQLSDTYGMFFCRLSMVLVSTESRPECSYFLVQCTAIVFNPPMLPDLEWAFPPPLGFYVALVGVFWGLLPRIARAVLHVVRNAKAVLELSGSGILDYCLSRLKFRCRLSVRERCGPVTVVFIYFVWY